MSNVGFMEILQIIAIIVAIGSLFIGIGSLIISISTHKMSLLSQKLQNAQTLVKSFYTSLRNDDIKEFRNIIMLRGESAGGDNNGHYMREDGELCDFSEYFIEGAPDGGALERIVYNLNRVCTFANNESIDLKFFYSELGHYIKICYEILEAINGADENIAHCYNELEQKYTDIPIMIVGYIE